MIALARDGYTEQEVKDALHAKRGSRKVRYRYELLDKNENKKADLYNVLSGDISFGVFNEIKRTAKFKLEDKADIDWLSDRIKPFFELLMNNSKWISFPLGVFLLSSPTKYDTANGVVREVDAYDGTIILRDDKFEDFYTVVKGTNYKDAVISILKSAGITKYIIADIDKTTNIDIQFDIGTSKLEAINKLLSLVDYTPIYCDANGYFVSRKYILPSVRPIDYTYKNDELSVISKGMSEELDLYNVPNKWIMVRTNEEQAPLKSVYTNNNPKSPTSTISRNRTIVDYRELNDIADQAALDSYTQRIAFEASQAFGKVKFSTAIMPMHDYYDVLRVEYSDLGIADNFTETSWSFPLTVGGKMTHEARKVVEI